MISFRTVSSTPYLHKEGGDDLVLADRTYETPHWDIRTNLAELHYRVIQVTPSDYKTYRGDDKNNANYGRVVRSKVLSVSGIEGDLPVSFTVNLYDTEDDKSGKKTSKGDVVRQPVIYLLICVADVCHVLVSVFASHSPFFKNPFGYLQHPEQRLGHVVIIVEPTKKAFKKFTYKYRTYKSRPVLKVWLMFTEMGIVPFIDQNKVVPFVYNIDKGAMKILDISWKIIPLLFSVHYDHHHHFTSAILGFLFKTSSTTFSRPSPSPPSPAHTSITVVLLSTTTAIITPQASLSLAHSSNTATL